MLCTFTAALSLFSLPALSPTWLSTKQMAYKSDRAEHRSESVKVGKSEVSHIHSLIANPSSVKLCLEVRCALKKVRHAPKLEPRLLS